jgi:hypothetical protein
MNLVKSAVKHERGSNTTVLKNKKRSNPNHGQIEECSRSGRPRTPASSSQRGKGKAGFPRRGRMPRSQRRVRMRTRLAPSLLSVGENLSTGSLVEEAKGFDRFEGSLLEVSGALRIWSREKFEDGSKHGRSEEAACSHHARQDFRCPA